MVAHQAQGQATQGGPNPARKGATAAGFMREIGGEKVTVGGHASWKNFTERDTSNESGRPLLLGATRGLRRQLGGNVYADTAFVWLQNYAAKSLILMVGAQGLEPWTR